MIECSQWKPYKKLNTTLITAISEKDESLLPDVEQELRKHKATFTGLLQHAVSMKLPLQNPLNK